MFNAYKFHLNKILIVLNVIAILKLSLPNILPDLGAKSLIEQTAT